MHSASVTRDRRGLTPRWGWLFLACLLALLACEASPDRAPRVERGPRAKPTRPEARDHLDRGNRLFRLGELDQAIEAYKAGSLLEDAPLFHFNLGQSFRKAGQYDKALWHFDQFAKHMRAEDPDRPILDEIIAQTEALKKSASAPPGEAMASAGSASAAPGSPVVAAPAQPLRSLPARSNAGAAPRRPTAPRPSSPAAEPKAGQGELVVMVTPWAAIWLNGRSLPGGTPYRTKVSVGRHRVRIANDDLRRQESLTVTVTANETTTIERTW
jgi:hypothetical protein